MIQPLRMSEAVKPSDVPPEERKTEGEIQLEMAQEKSATETSDIEPKKVDDATVKVEEIPEAIEIKTEKDATQSATREATAAVESAAGKILNAGPSIKIEPGILGDNAGDIQGKEAEGDHVKLDKEVPTENISEESAVPALPKTSTDETTLVPNVKVPLGEKVETTMKTDTSGADIESLKDKEELKSKDAPSSHVELSGSTTETMDIASSDPPPSSVKSTPAVPPSSSVESKPAVPPPSSVESTPAIPPPSSVESTPAVSANNEIKTDIVPISDVKEQTISTAETTISREIKKESDLITYTQRATSEDSASNISDKMEIDSESKSLMDISKDNVQNEETLAQGNVQKTNLPSDVGVQNRETHDANGEQKPETTSLHSYLPVQQKESVTMDITQKNQNKAVHEIIAEQSSRLDREMIVSTPVTLDRPSLVQSSVPPIEEDIPTTVPSAVRTPVPSAVQTPVPSAVRTPVPSAVQTPVPSAVQTPVPSAVQTLVPSAAQTPVPATLPSEKESAVSIPVPAERSEPVAHPDLAVPVTKSDPKTEVQESLDDWDIPATDDEEEDEENQAADGIEKKKRKVVKRGYWEPPIDVIVDLYKKLDQDGILELSWKCPGRRPPSEEGDKEEEKEEMEDVQDEEAMEISQEEDPTEFDFDMDIELDSSVQKKMTPRRNIGGGQAQGSGKKRVARMDKVLNDIFRHRKIDTSLTDAQKKDGQEDKESDQAMDTTVSPILGLNRPSDKFHIRSDLNG
eukprot:XP_797831.3 PREDICTED: proteoglycan 4 isoform X1 [Strongylocentrotus purpuratus]